jgi:hypothetical protein
MVAPLMPITFRRCRRHPEQLGGPQRRLGETVLGFGELDACSRARRGPWRDARPACAEGSTRESTVSSFTTPGLDFIRNITGSIFQLQESLLGDSPRCRGPPSTAADLNPRCIGEKRGRRQWWVARERVRRDAGCRPRPAGHEGTPQKKGRADLAHQRRRDAAADHPLSGHSHQRHRVLAAPGKPSPRPADRRAGPAGEGGGSR